MDKNTTQKEKKILNAIRQRVEHTLQIKKNKHINIRTYMIMCGLIWSINLMAYRA